MEKLNIQILKDLKSFLILWSTQGLSQLGSAMTTFALTLWLYQKTGSSLQTALLSICSYAPYVLMSVFAGALSDRWDKKKTMLWCDTLAALCTVIVFVLLKLDLLLPVHLYILNAIGGLMNTVQQPASEVAQTLIVPKEHFQITGGLNNITRSCVTILNPILATSLYAGLGMWAVIGFDLITFVISFLALLVFIKLPQLDSNKHIEESVIESTKSGIKYLKHNPLVFNLILFLSGVNLVASIFDATLPGLVIPHPNGGEVALSIVSATAGLACLAGGILATILPKPKNRVRVIFLTMLFSITIENFVLAFTNNVTLWCIGQVLGWIVVPVMSTNLDVILRSEIPVEMQGRVYACRNTFQFFTIPIGLFLGGFLVDQVFEPLMQKVSTNSYLHIIFGNYKGSGAAIVMFLIGVLGGLICVVFYRRLREFSY